MPRERLCQGEARRRRRSEGNEEGEALRPALAQGGRCGAMIVDGPNPRRRVRQRLGIGDNTALAANAVDRGHGMVPRFQPKTRQRGPVDRRSAVEVKSKPVAQAADGHAEGKAHEPRKVQPA
jgi:hypothetical protein